MQLLSSLLKSERLALKTVNAALYSGNLFAGWNIVIGIPSVLDHVAGWRMLCDYKLLALLNNQILLVFLY